MSKILNEEYWNNKVDQLISDLCDFHKWFMENILKFFYAFNQYRDVTKVQIKEYIFEKAICKPTFDITHYKNLRASQRHFIYTVKNEFETVLEMEISTDWAPDFAYRPKIFIFSRGDWELLLPSLEYHIAKENYGIKLYNAKSNLGMNKENRIYPSNSKKIQAIECPKCHAPLNITLNKCEYCGFGFLKV